MDRMDEAVPCVPDILVSEKRSISHDSVLYRKKPILCFESFIVRFLMGGGIND